MHFTHVDGVLVCLQSGTSFEIVQLGSYIGLSLCFSMENLSLCLISPTLLIYVTTCKLHVHELRWITGRKGSQVE